MGYHQEKNLLITEVPEGDEKEKVVESLVEEIMAENFSNLGRDFGNPSS